MEQGIVRAPVRSDIAREIPIEEKLIQIIRSVERFEIKEKSIGKDSEKDYVLLVDSREDFRELKNNTISIYTGNASYNEVSSLSKTRSEFWNIVAYSSDDEDLWKKTVSSYRGLKKADVRYKTHCKHFNFLCETIKDLVFSSRIRIYKVPSVFLKQENETQELRRGGDYGKMMGSVTPFQKLEPFEIFQAPLINEILIRNHLVSKLRDELKFRNSLYKRKNA